MKHTFSLVAVCYLGGFLFSGCGNRTQFKTTQDTIGVTILKLGGIHNGTDKVGYNGTLQADRTIDLSFQVSGTITSIPVQTGDFVRKGQLLASVDETVYRSQYNSQLAQRKLAGENYSRILEVYKKGSIAEIKMLEAKSNFEQATSAAKATYQNIVHTKLFAAENGYIGEKNAEAGSTASPGKPVIQLLDIRSVQVLVAVPENEINKYKAGDEAIVTVDALEGRSLTGHVSEIGVLAQQNSASYNVKVKLSNAAKQLRPGMLCKVTIQPGKQVSGADSVSQELVVPVQTVQIDEQDNKFVYILDGDGKKALKKKVTTGSLFNSGIAIKSGLSGNESLITSGYQKLNNNSPVKINKK